MVAEVVGGYLASSIALMTDATHMLTDLIANAIGLFAIGSLRRAGAAHSRSDIIGWRF